MHSSRLKRRERRESPPVAYDFVIVIGAARASSLLALWKLWDVEREREALSRVMAVASFVPSPCRTGIGGAIVNNLSSQVVEENFLGLWKFGKGHA